MPRKTISSQTETAVLTLSRRRCALCFGLHRDLEEKRGQIAHINRNFEDSALENLVFLCMLHHDEYDSTTRQSKGLTPPELRLYRQELYDCLEGGFSPREAVQGEYSVYQRFISPRWRHVYVEALEFHAGIPHRTQAAVLALADGEKELAEINAGIPPNDLAWTTAILNDALQRGWIERTADRFRLALRARVILEALADIPEAVKEDAWRRNWFPKVAGRSAFHRILYHEGANQHSRN